MRKIWVGILVAVCLPVAAFGSEQLDTQYGFRSVGVAVLRTEANPIFAGQVQRAIESELGQLARFETRPEVSETLVKETQFIEALDGFATVAWVKPLSVLGETGTQAAVFANIIPVDADDELGRASLQLAFIASDGTPIYRSESPIEDSKSLPSYVGTARRMVREMSGALPFDATILSREGYRVVLDHGLPEVYSGLKLAAFTIERQDGKLGLVETGRIQITRAESRLAFGQVIVEKKPLTVNSLNKVRFEPVKETETYVPLFASPSRGLSSLPGESSVEDVGAEDTFASSVAGFSKAAHGRFGNVGINFIGSLVTWNRTGANNSQVGSDSSLYPGVGIEGEVWITRNWIAEAGFNLALAGLNAPASSGATTLNSQLNEIHLMAGYRFRLLDDAMTPILTLKLGLAKTQYQVDTASSALAAVAGSYSGIKVGVDIGLPLSDTFGMGLTTAFLPFPSYSQTPAVATTSVSAWEFGINSYLFWTPTLMFEGSLTFQAHNVDFANGSVNSVMSASQNQRRFGLGAKYFF